MYADSQNKRTQLPRYALSLYSTHNKELTILTKVVLKRVNYVVTQIRVHPSLFSDKED
jgi:hypothetical protein